MPGGRGTEKRRLDGGAVLVRLPGGTDSLVRREADRAGLTAAAWVRRQLVDLVGADPGDTVPARALPLPRPRPSADMLAIARLREAVGEATGTLRQVAGLDRRRRVGARLNEIDVAIDRLLLVAADLDAAKRLLRGDS